MQAYIKYNYMKINNELKNNNDFQHTNFGEYSKLYGFLQRHTRRLKEYYKGTLSKGARTNKPNMVHATKN